MSNRESSLRKAAVLVASLDDDTADEVLAQMSPDQADAVRREVQMLEDLDPEEQQAVIDEFFRIGPLMPEQDPPGLELNDHLAERLALPIDEYVPSEDVPNEPIRAASSRSAAIDRTARQSIANREPFDFLQDFEPAALVPFLEREHPQAIALVLAHLPPESASHVLARLPALVQTDVIRRLMDLEETDPQVLREVEKAVESWLHTRRPRRRRVAGAHTVSAILNSADGSARRQILNNLAVHNRPLAHRLAPPQPAPRRFTFAELCEAGIETLFCVVRAADHQTRVLALAGTSSDLIDAMLDRLEPEEADRLDVALTQLGPMRLADIDRAQERLAEIASQLHADGNLAGVNGTHLTAVA
jgi:flagellar motor switch protein FliG